MRKISNSAIIVDDESKSKLVLRKMLETYCPQITVVGDASSIHEAYTLILENSPDLVFLDVEMPHGSGFELLKKFTTLSFDVIFVTAFDQYALQAIKVCALDYLLKPVDIDELQDAIQKWEEKKQKQLLDTRLTHLLENLQNTIVNSHKIALPTGMGFEFVEVDQIINCEADGNYTIFHFTDASRRMTTGKIKEFEEVLQEYQFVRVHKSHLINLKFIRQYVKIDGGYFVMENKQQIPISRRKKDEVLKTLMSYSPNRLLIA